MTSEEARAELVDRARENLSPPQAAFLNAHVSGDLEGARRTWRRWIDQGPTAAEVEEFRAACTAAEQAAKNNH